MAKNIVLTSEDLESQAQQIESLMSNYDSMFTNLTTILNTMNEGWSQNIASNFIDKISLAQKSFSTIVELLGSGANAAKDAASGFSDLNTSLAKGLEELTESGILSSLKIGDLSSAQFQEAWSNITSNLGSLSNLIPDGSTMEEVLDYLQQAEKGTFGTEYISEARNILDTVGDVFDGTISSETVGKVADLFGGYDEILSEIGFSDGVAGSIVSEGVKLIYGDGENIDTISQSMIDYCDDMQQVQQTISEGQYVEGVLQGYVRSIEGGAKITAEAVTNIGENILDKIGDYGDAYSNASDAEKAAIIMTNPTQAIVGTIKNDVDWDGIASTIKESTGVDPTNFLSELGQNISDDFSKRADETVEGIPIVAEYVGEVASSIGSGVVDAFKGLLNSF